MMKPRTKGNEGSIYVYRGVHGLHPALDDARRGKVFAAKPDAQLTPGVHHAGTYSGESQFTSWTYDFGTACDFAKSKAPAGPIGVVVRVEKYEAGAGDSWCWNESSPGRYTDEQEVLLKGGRIDAEVVYDGSTDENAEAS